MLGYVLPYSNEYRYRQTEYQLCSRIRFIRGSESFWISVLLGYLPLLVRPIGFRVSRRLLNEPFVHYKIRWGLHVRRLCSLSVYGSLLTPFCSSILMGYLRNVSRGNPRLC
jgi:hypothetical protein